MTEASGSGRFLFPFCSLIKLILVPIASYNCLIRSRMFMFAPISLCTVGSSSDPSYRHTYCTFYRSLSTLSISATESRLAILPGRLLGLKRLDYCLLKIPGSFGLRPPTDESCLCMIYFKLLKTT